jgi:hypothetical protein
MRPSGLRYGNVTVVVASVIERRTQADGPDGR